ncbi:GIY-YIG nuclease family protein [Microbacterium phosphatis]|uniref:GIY-YIG nuclease family protein n=1 Tax=Microbacterium phosphatis TaxID=3140248 RepID=UPI0031406820
MSGHVYLLRCADGSTRDLDGRVWQHNQGLGSAYTRRRGRRPVVLIWSWEFESVAEAFHWEKQIQGWSRRKRELLVEGGLDAVKGWSARERRRASDVDVPPPSPTGRRASEASRNGPTAVRHNPARG